VLYGISQCFLPPIRDDIPIKAGTRFSDPRRMQGWVDLVGLIIYQGGIPARRQSPIPVLTGLSVEYLHSCDERRYHNAKPPTITMNDSWPNREPCSILLFNDFQEETWRLISTLCCRLLMEMLVYSGQALISGDTLQPTTYTGLPQYPGLGGFGTFHTHTTLFTTCAR